MSKIKRLRINAVGTDYFIGDIHGCYSALVIALRRKNFNPLVDRLFSTGDLTDRGPESHRVFEFLDYPWFHPVLGNHEAMAYQTAKLFLASGRPYDIDYLKSNNANARIFLDYGGEWMLNATDDFLIELIRRYESLPIAIEYVDQSDALLAVVLHAEVGINDHWDQVRSDLNSLPADYVFDLENKANRTSSMLATVGNLLWSRTINETSLLKNVFKRRALSTSGAPLVISGHTIVAPGNGPWRVKNHRFIDHGLYDSGKAEIYTYAEIV
jgi:hypothetical protein